MPETCTDMAMDCVHEAEGSQQQAGGEEHVEEPQPQHRAGARGGDVLWRIYKQWRRL